MGAGQRRQPHHALTEEPAMPAQRTVSNEEKRDVWEAYRAGHPIRVPVLLATNPRIILLDPALNPKGVTFEDYFDGAETMLEIGLRHACHRANVIHRYTDDPVGLPDRWTVHVDRQNVYEAAYFGSPVVHRPGQVPDAIPWLTDDNKRAVFERDITNPLAEGFFRDALDLCHQMQALAADRTFEGRPVDVADYTPTGSDGPLTVAVSLRGQGMLLDLAVDPDYAEELMAFITQAAINRVEALRGYWGRPHLGVGLADDAVQLIGTRSYQSQVLSHHQRFYAEAELPGQRRSIHLCGDATRHFGILHRELGVTSFDTGFPVDFGALRRELGPDVEILGGPEVAILLHGTPRQVYDRTCDILRSGIKKGGRFVLREGNNLPPQTPTDNLAAMYAACLDQGRYR